MFGAVFSGEQEQLDIVVPGIAGMSVMAATFVALAYNLVFLRERGILKRLRGTPLPSSAYLAGIAANAVMNTVLQIAVVIVAGRAFFRSEEHTSEPQSRLHLVCHLPRQKKTFTC